MIDQGRNTREVLDRLIELKQRTGVVLIQGNHEEMLYAARENEQALRYWEDCGGVATLNSYRFGGGLADIPLEHWILLDECRAYYETEGFLFTHANYLPDVPMAVQPGYQLRWALFDRESIRPHASGKPVLVGHREQMDGEIVDLGFAICLDTACWRHGWLTAMEVTTKQIWQASRWGILRDPGEPSRGARLTELLNPGGGETLSVD
jgi:serine/threonine protein phosphatase 1